MKKYLFFIFLCVVFIACKEVSQSPASPSATVLGINGGVFALTVYNGNLIVGGSFSEAVTTPANNIAQWNGSQFSTLGTGLPSNASSLTTYNGNLIAGISNGGIMQWNGDFWSSIGQVFKSSASVNTLTTYNGNLIVGGSFDSISGVKASNIAQWNGTGWSAIGIGLSKGISCLAVYNGNLIAAGYSTIQQWNGSNWMLIGTTNIAPANINWTSALCVFNNNLVAAGGFDSISGMPVNNIAQWNGSTWSHVGIDSSLNNSMGCTSVNVYNGTLVLVDEYSTINVLHGAIWSALGGTENYGYHGSGAPGGNVVGLQYNGGFYVGGNFISCNNVSATDIVEYNGSSWTAL